MMRLLAYLAIVAVPACNLLKPQVPDVTPDADPSGQLVLPAGTTVPPITDNAELTNQIKLFCGLNAAALAQAGGVLVRSVGKANGVPVKFWSFGSAPIVDGFVASSL